uniref:Late embryogenesis abundant protein LEA-2 subgroup domain-containing protein n=1 Tax=Oryza punctata TaxID=4537 RepID=A0A0E0JLX2_ORYPU
MIDLNSYVLADDDHLKYFYVPISIMVLAFNDFSVFIVVPIIDRPPDPDFSVRLVGVEGLDPDPCLQSGPVSPVYDLAMDVDGVSPSYRACGGGGDDTVLRVSYRCIFLAWGRVPSFCIDGELLEEHGKADSVVIVRAEAWACATIRDDLRNLNMDRATRPKKDRSMELAHGLVLLYVTPVVLCYVVVLMAPIIDGPPDPNFFVRLVGVEGLDTRLSGPKSPVFDLAVDVAGVSPRYQACGGGRDDTMLRVSYHGIVLAWAAVPSFCIDGKLLEGGCAEGVIVVKAEAAANAKMRKDLRNLIWTERHVLGKVDFDVEGNLGKVTHDNLTCKVTSFEGAKHH